MSEADQQLLEAFVAWFERENVGAAFDNFIVENAHLFKVDSTTNADAEEHHHDWWPVYQAYQAQFEERLGAFTTEAGVSAEDFLRAAQNAEGLHESYIQVFLAHSEYDLFRSLMAEELEKQAAN